MSDDNIIHLFPGEPVDPPSDTEPAVEVILEDKMLEASRAIEDHRKIHNHASDVNPNEGNLTFPRVNFQWTANASYMRVQVANDDFADIPLSKTDIFLMVTEMMTYLKARLFHT